MPDMVERVLADIRELRRSRERIIVAIDGRCASGKTTLAEELREALGCNVFHMDDFFLREEQRTRERYAEPGGNVDRERFLREVLQPLRDGREFSYQPFDCHRMALRDPVAVAPGDVSVIEGTYSCHPSLREKYDLRIFLTTSQKTQAERIGKRNGVDADAFRERWIPLEERYFEACGVEEQCELVFQT